MFIYLTTDGAIIDTHL